MSSGCGGLAGFMDDPFVILQSNKAVSRTWTCNPCEECFESPNLQRSGRTSGCFDIGRTCRAGAWAMSQRKPIDVRSGLRTWTKQEEMKESTNPST